MITITSFYRDKGKPSLKSTRVLSSHDVHARFHAYSQRKPNAKMWRFFCFWRFWLDKFSFANSRTRLIRVRTKILVTIHETTKHQCGSYIPKRLNLKRLFYKSANIPFNLSVISMDPRWSSYPTTNSPQRFAWVCDEEKPLHIWWAILRPNWWCSDGFSIRPCLS